MNYTIDHIREALAGEVVEFIEGSPAVQLTNATTVNNANKSSVVWIKPGSQKAGEVRKITAAVIICDRQTLEAVRPQSTESTFIICANPKLTFSKLVNKLFVNRPAAGIHASAVIHPEAVIGKNCTIGPFTYIGKSAVGSDTVIHGHCHIYDGVTIGARCIFHAGVVIGSDGFGYSKNEDGSVEKFPHIGGVVIGNDVEIGSHTCVDRGALGDTIIENDVKIDNLVHVAHNVLIREHVYIIANAMLGGSTTIGRNAWIAPSVSLLQQLQIGENSTIGVGSVVTKNVPAGETWAGSPASRMDQFLATQKKIKDLP